MKLNVGKIDRIARVVLGAALLGLWFFDPTNLLWLIGIVPLATGLFSFCPVYQLAGVSTCPTNSGTKKAG